MKFEARSREITMLLILSAMFLTLCFSNIRSIGSSKDELDPARFAINVLTGSNVSTPADHELKIPFFKTPCPVNYINDYCFALPDYLLLIFFTLFGINIIALKAMPIFFTWIFLLMLYKLIKELFDKNIAFLSCFLLVINPSFLHIARIGLHITEPLLNFIFIAFIFFSVMYFKKNKSGYLYTAALFLGLGLSVKITFFSRIFGLIIAGVLIFSSRLRSGILKKLRSPASYLAILFFLLGSSLFIYHNIFGQTPGSFFKFTKFLKPGVTTATGVNNLAFSNNLKVRYGHLKQMLLNDSAFIHIPYASRLEENIVSPTKKKDLIFAILIIAFIFNIELVLFSKAHQAYRQKLFFIYLLYGSIFFSSLFTPFSMRALHLTMLYPFPQFILAMFVVSLARLSARKIDSKTLKTIIKSLIVLILLYPTIGRNIRILSAYYNIYEETGGETYWSDYTNKLLEYIQQNNIEPQEIYALSWGVDTSLIFYSQGKININETIFYNYSSDEFERLKTELDRILKNKKNAYFIYTIWDQKAEILNLFNTYVDQPQIELLETKTISNKIGKPIHQIYRLKHR